MNAFTCPAVAAVLAVACSAPVAAEQPSREEAAAALSRAVSFFRDQVSAEGGYLWRYSADLSTREGEGKAEPLTAWVQPPGTPSVGDAYLTAYELTDDTEYLQAARESAGALIRSQLRSGGWDYRIEFDPRHRRRWAYRVDEPNPDGRNVTTLDDNTTQAALRFLMDVDRAQSFRDGTVHEAVLYGLHALLKAQYPNGAWPQRYSKFPDPARHPVRSADYPQTWPREWPDADYRGFYTFNDNTIADLIETMLDAADTYDDEKYRDAALRAGDFILLAQMPAPQPAWAQQYDADMHPVWARRFEPPAITGGESQGVLRTLLLLYRRTGEQRFLEPVPRALEYLSNSRLPDGRLARFYELRTNRPLYFTKDYELTYNSDDLPTHYGFITSSRLDDIAAEYERLKQLDTKPSRATRRRQDGAVRMTPELAERARSIIETQDERGAWVESGRLRTIEGAGASAIISSRTFCANVQTLARYIAARDRAKPK